MRTSKTLLTASTALALTFTASAWAPGWAQQQGQPQQQIQGQQAQQQTIQQQPGAQQAGQERIDLVTWNEAQDQLREGWTARWMFDQSVYDLEGNDVGEVENIFIGPDGRIQSIVMETGGFIGIGDVPVRIPWQDVEFTQDARIVADVREENLPNFELFADDPDPQQRAFRADELIGDYVRLEDQQPYGYMSDIIFDTEGQVTSVIVSPSYGWGARYGTPYGRYAYPYYGYGYGYGFAPGSPYYDMPYTAEETAQQQPYDYQGMPRRGTIRGDDGQVVIRDGQTQQQPTGGGQAVQPQQRQQRQ